MLLLLALPWLCNLEQDTYLLWASVFFFPQYLGEINVSMDNIYLIIHYICAYVWERLKVLNSARKKEMKILILVVLKNWVLKNLRIF